MSSENFPTQPSAEQAIPVDPEVLARTQAVIDHYGGEDHFLERYGLGISELSQTVNFSSYSGPLWEAIVPDPELAKGPHGQSAAGVGGCPVGGMLESAKQADGLAGVREKLTGLSMLDSRFKVDLSERTVAKVLNIEQAAGAEQLKKN